jgi:uncharacterized protein (TIGR02757 family)
LERLRERFDERYLATDPVEFPRRYRSAADREIVGLVAAALAYGNVKTIRSSVEKVLAFLGTEPAARLRRSSPGEIRDALRDFRHRWTRGRDVACLLVFTGRMLEQSGGVGAFFREGYVPGNMAESLLSFTQRALRLDHGGLFRTRSLPGEAGVRFFFPSPATGAAKRLNMYLRWMARPDDGVDLGLWSFVPTRDLVVPLDTHIFRIGRHLGWTERKTASWRAAVDITRSLARVDPEDPVKYDFALSRMGMLEGCPRHSRKLACDLCELRRLTQRDPQTSRDGATRGPGGPHPPRAKSDGSEPSEERGEH